jgi:hypothetical protein
MVRFASLTHHGFACGERGRQEAAKSNPNSLNYRLSIGYNTTSKIETQRGPLTLPSPAPPLQLGGPANDLVAGRGEGIVTKGVS